MNEPDNPSDFDPKAYRSALGGFGTGVALVAARDAQGRAHGLIINSLTSVSLHPPIMLWCLANSSKAFEVFTNAGTFSLNILRSDDHDVARRFSRSGDRIIPEDQICTMETGAPVLAAAVASLEHLQAFAEAGLGAVVLPDYLLGPALAERRLVRVHPSTPGRARVATNTLFLVARRGVPLTARLTAVRQALLDQR